MKFDVESFYDYCVTLLKDNIADKIQSINAEKKDNLLKIPQPHQFYSDFAEKILAEEFFIYYTLVDARPIDNVGEYHSVEVTMMFYIGFIDIDGGEDMIRRGIRYTRAMTEIFQSAFSNNSQISNIEIFQHLPQSAQFEKSSEWYKIGGIEIKGTIAP